MQIIPPVRVKVSCLRSVEEAQRAVSFGASAIGMASGMPAAEDELSEPEIAAIAGSVDPEIGTFLLTALSEPEEIAGRAVRCGVNTVQLWDVLPRGAYETIRRTAPGLAIAQSLHVTDASALDAALELAGAVDALVLDSVDPEPPFRWASRHGRTHDWEISRRIVAAVQLPVILSGGLSRRNVADAIRTVRPYGVEVCSSVRRSGALHTPALVGFFETVGRTGP